jgi:phosphatidylglycerol:prolipoprotein diacylglycerol transferase
MSAYMSAFSSMSAGDILSFIFGDMVFYGAMIGGIVGLFVYCRMFKKSFLSMLDLGAAVLPLGHAFGRIGCVFAGCCYGIEVEHSHPLAMVYPGYPEWMEHSVLAPSGVPLLAVPAMEAAFLFILFAANAAIFKRSSNRGLCTSVYFLAYGTWRFIIEFFRGDALRGVYNGLSTSQYVAICLIIAGVILLFLINRKNRKSDLNR